MWGSAYLWIISPIILLIASITEVIEFVDTRLEIILYCDIVQILKDIIRIIRSIDLTQITRENVWKVIVHIGWVILVYIASQVYNSETLTQNPISNIANGRVTITIISRFFLILSQLYYVTIKVQKPVVITFILQKIYSISENLVKDNLGNKGYTYISIVATLFTTIILTNLMGRVPFGFTLSSGLAVTLAFSTRVFGYVNILGYMLYKNKLAAARHPGAVMGAIKPMLFLIEIISYFARLISLAVRLFANRRAGHTLLKILAGFSTFFIMAKMALFTVVGVIINIVIFFVILLELLVAFLQAYVFTVLACRYFSDIKSLT